MTGRLAKLEPLGLWMLLGFALLFFWGCDDDGTGSDCDPEEIDSPCDTETETLHMDTPKPRAASDMDGGA